MNSPLRPAAATLLAGSVAGLLAWNACFAAVGFAAAAAVAFLFATGRTRLAWTIAACALAALAGFARGAAACDGPPDAPARPIVSAMGVVVRAADFDDSTRGDGDCEARLRFAPDGADSPLLDVRVRYRDGDDVPEFLPGDRVRLVGSVAPLRAPSNPGEPDRRTQMRREGVCGEMDVPSPGAVAELEAAPPGAAMRIRRAGEVARRALLLRLRDACGGPGRTSALLGCLLLGDRTGLDEPTSTAFRDSGTAHLLSVSGLHVVLLAAAGAWLARRVTPRRLRRRFGLPTLLLLLAAYCALCRFATPVVRAAVFLGIAEIARATGRRPSPLDTLAAAAALVVAVEPAQVLDPSFQLSFAAVAGLALFTTAFRVTLFPSLDLYRKFPGAIPAWRLRAMTWLARALSTSLAASVATAPIVAEVFGRLQPVAPLANLVAVPIAAVLVPLAACLAIVGGVAVPITAPIADLAAAALRVSVALPARLPAATIGVGFPPAALLAFSVALLLLAAVLARSRARAACASALVAWTALAAAPFCIPRPGRPEVIALDVGHGLCVLVRTPGNGDVVFDAGGHAPGIGRWTIAPALRELGVRRLGAVFVSHQDSDHCSAVMDLLDAFPVGEVAVSAGFGADPLPRAIVARCRRMAVPVTVVARGDVWARRGVEFRVLSPRRDARPPPDNEVSIVAHVTLDGLTLALPGDVEGDPLRALVADATVPPARLLVLPHHGRGDPALHLAFAQRLGAEDLVASASASTPMNVPQAMVTGVAGAIRVRPGEAPAAFPWR